MIPMNVKIRNNYAMELKGRGQIEEARKQYQVRSSAFNLTHGTSIAVWLGSVFICTDLLSHYI